ncbi:MAG: cupin domain-containing protein [Deltaproteobacteria bacterium]|nr:cupin domain-containing protein [Deltaproteobacteria bacterium]MBW2123091.1 cupin domain-containing protein [Deltaproteobacteria bacterium]
MKIGSKIRSLRQQRELTQEELAERAGLTKGFISQVERDLTSISLDSLIQILEALGEKASDFFGDIEKERIVYRVKDRVDLQKRNGVKGFFLPIPGSTNRLMEPAILTLGPRESTEREEAHPGEELGYVLKGRVAIHFGKRAHRAREGECFYFTADRDHFIENMGPSDAVIFWITAPPAF